MTAPCAKATQKRTGRSHLQAVLSLGVFITVPLWFLLRAAGAQEGDQEIVANLAAGRVVIYVARDAVIVGAIQENIEPDSRAPQVLPLGGSRVGVLLGAAEWVSPASGRPPVRLDRELPGLASEAARPAPKADSERAGDIEAIGVALLERLRGVTSQLHRRIDLKPDEPVVELLVAGFEEGYGAEAWLLRYHLAQEPVRGDFWRTRVLRPSYTQLYPPEKGQPRTLLEVRYPEDIAAPKLLDLLQRDDPRLARLRNSDPRMMRAAEHIEKGDTQKANPEDASAFLRAALPIVAPENAQLVIGIVQRDRGFQWILEPAEKPAESKPREAGAPTLRKKP